MHATPAIILKREDFRERDEQILVYTKNFGKMTVIGRGFKRIEAKLRGGADLFNVVDMLFVEGASFPILTGVDTKEHFFSVGNNPFSYGAALAIAETVAEVFEERAKDVQFFNVICGSFADLNRCAEENTRDAALYAWVIFKKFQATVLGSQGYGARDIPDIFQKDFARTESFFVRSFAYYFNYSVPSWLPR